MTAGQSPQHPRRKVLAMALAAVASLASLGAVSGCASESKSLARAARQHHRRPRHRRHPRQVHAARGDGFEDAGKLLAKIEGPVRYVVKRPMPRGVGRSPPSRTTPDITFDQAVATLQAAPRVESATSDRMLKPHRTMPTSRGHARAIKRPFSCRLLFSSSHRTTNAPRSRRCHTTR